MAFLVSLIRDTIRMTKEIKKGKKEDESAGDQTIGLYWWRWPLFSI